MPKQVRERWVEIASGQNFKPCPECGEQISDMEVVQTAIAHAGRAFAGSGLPTKYYLALTCSACGSARFFDAEKLGLVV